MSKIIHVVNDCKFASLIIKTFEASHVGINHYIVINGRPEAYNIYQNKVKIEFLSHAEIMSKYGGGFGFDTELVCLHRLDEWNTRFGLKLLEWHQVLPFLWAGEYAFLLNDLRTDAYLPKTNNWEINHRPFRQKLKMRISNLVPSKVLKALNTQRRLQIKLLDSVTHFVTPVYDEAEDIVERNCISGKPLFVPYGSLEQSLGSTGMEVEVFGDSIQLAHSGSKLNNHIDMIEWLSKIIPNCMELTVPLAYGPLGYINFVSDYGKRVMPKSFNPITEFMEAQEYFYKMRKCSTMIMPQLVQHGVGNIRCMLHAGARIYMFEQNPVYRFLRRHGAFVYSLDEAINTGILNTQPLNSETRVTNRKACQDIWGLESSISARRESLAEVIRSNKS
jgi:dTDP-N-acetylfucosamine:lipid II N-acetylfucosaminyltransferase